MTEPPTASPPRPPDDPRAPESTVAASVGSPPSSLSSTARRAWIDLSSPTRPAGPLDPARRADLPPAAQRWLGRAIGADAGPASSVELWMQGEIRIGRWKPFRARQVIAPGRGFVWAATAGRLPVRVRGFDRYSNSQGEMRWRLFGAIPVMSASGPDIDRSAAGRLAAEFVFCPAAALAPGVSWSKVDDERATAVIAIDGTVHRVTIRVDDEGRLRTVELPRWGDPDGSGFRERTSSSRATRSGTSRATRSPRGAEPGGRRRGAGGPRASSSGRASSAPSSGEMGDLGAELERGRAM